MMRSPSANEGVASTIVSTISVIAAAIAPASGRRSWATRSLNLLAHTGRAGLSPRSRRKRSR
jgi:hypothetical protein